MYVLRNGLQASAKPNVFIDLYRRGHSLSQSPCPWVESEPCSGHAVAEDNFEDFLCAYGSTTGFLLCFHGIYDPLFLFSPSVLLLSIAGSKAGGSQSLHCAILERAVESDRSGLDSWLHHLLAVGLRARVLVSLNLSFFICKIKIIKCF